MIRLIKAIFLIIPRIIYWYFSWILIYYLRRNNISFEQKFYKVKYCCLKVLKILGVKLDVENLEIFNDISNDKKVLIVCNHQSMLDPVVLIALSNTPFTLIAKKQIGHYPFVGKVLKLLNGETLDRSDLKKQVKTILKVEQSISANKNSWAIFPEGKRQKKPYEGILEVHHGSFKIVKNSKCDLYVCSIFGSYRPLQFFKYHQLHPVVQFRVNEKIKSDFYSNLSTKEIAEKIQKIFTLNYDKMLEKDKKNYKIKS